MPKSRQNDIIIISAVNEFVPTDSTEGWHLNISIWMHDSAPRHPLLRDKYKVHLIGFQVTTVAEFDANEIAFDWSK